jgi:DNA-binding MarR family transcriptional regulator
VNDYAKQAGVNKSVMSRHLLDIGPRMRNQSTGFGLVEGRRSLEEMRRVEVYLTAKGRRLAERIRDYWQS